jgi:hypothetical protein
MNLLKNNTIEMPCFRGFSKFSTKVKLKGEALGIAKEKLGYRFAQCRNIQQVGSRGYILNFSVFV